MFLRITKKKNSSVFLHLIERTLVVMANIGYRLTWLQRYRIIRLVLGAGKT